MKFLKENDEQPFFRDISVLNSGSYYELVKVNKKTLTMFNMIETVF